MNISTEWLLNLKKRFIFADGWISAENLANFGEICFRLGVQWLYKWRRFLIEQPKDRDIVVIKNYSTSNPKLYRVCIYLAGTKSLIDITTKEKVTVNSSTIWKLVETEETLDKFDMSKFKDVDPCSINCKSTKNIEK